MIREITEDYVAIVAWEIGLRTEIGRVALRNAMENVKRLDDEQYSKGSVHDATTRPNTEA
jgi:hypothetical protein